MPLLKPKVKVKLTPDEIDTAIGELLDTAVKKCGKELIAAWKLSRELPYPPGGGFSGLIGDCLFDRLQPKL